MMLPETSGLVAVTSMIGEAFQEGDPQRGRKNWRARQIREFLGQANKLLDRYGIDESSAWTLGGIPRGGMLHSNVATRPVAVLVSGQEFRLRVVYIGDVSQDHGYLFTDRWTAIDASTGDSQTTRHLIGIKRRAVTPDGGITTSRSFVRNHLGRIASDAEFTTGLQVLDYIGDELALRPMWDSLNR